MLLVVRESGNGIRDLAATREAGCDKIWVWIRGELEKKRYSG